MVSTLLANPLGTKATPPREEEGGRPRVGRVCPEEGGASSPYLLHSSLLDSPFCCQEGQSCYFEPAAWSKTEEGGEDDKMWQSDLGRPLPTFALLHLEEETPQL